MEKRPEPITLFLLHIVRAILLTLIVITLPLGYVISRIINYVGTDIIRVRAGHVQLPVVTFVHPDTKRVVTLVGMMHYAIPEFFREIKQIIDAQIGNTILYEGPEKGWLKRLNGLTYREQCAVRWQRISSLKEACEARRMGLQFQMYGLREEPHWICNDLSALELIRLHLKYSLYPPTLDTTMPTGHNNRWLMNLGLINMPSISYFMPLVALLTPDFQDRIRISLDIRNEVAIKKMFEQCQHSDVTCIWGAEHIKAFGKALRRAGFIETKRTWHTCYIKQKFPFFETETEE